MPNTTRISPSLNGPVDQFGRNFKTYLEENPDELRRFSTAWAEGDAQVLMNIVQRFFDGLPDYQDLGMLDSQGENLLGFHKVQNWGRSLASVVYTRH